jgi:hypothetical protein
MKIKHLVVMGAMVAAFALPRTTHGHCDTMDGPVVVDARKALETKELTPVLKWVKQHDEPEIRKAFARTLAVRGSGPAARELADQFFFETLVRVHRAAEGAPYTGLKPAGAPVEPGIREADEALEKGKVTTLVSELQEGVAKGVQKRFADALEKKKHAEHNVEAGREFVAAYVEFMHYVEGVQQKLSGPGHAHGEQHVQGAGQEHERGAPAADQAKHSH